MRHKEKAVIVLAITSLLAVSGFLAFLSPLVNASDSGAPATPIKHLIVIVKENHSFDNYFGLFPGVVGGISPNKCIEQKTGCYFPFDLNGTSHNTAKHSFLPAYTDWNYGKMNNFFVGEAHNKDAFGYYDSKTLSSYWKYAQNYVLDDEMFASVLGYSLPNHWLAQAAATPVCAVNYLCVHNNLQEYLNESQGIPTIADVLIGSHVSWNYYDYAIGNNYTAAVRAAESGKCTSGDNACSYWNPFAAQKKSYGPTYSSHFVPNAQIFSDLAYGNLPSVSWVIPNFGASEHPGANITVGMDWTTAIVNAVMQSKYWSSSAIIIYWDDWGGFYDGVAPPKLPSNECIKTGYSVTGNPGCYLGFRVPALVISPYSKKGFIDNTPYYFESMLKFVEYNWHLGNLNDRDLNANNILNSFNFRQSPLPPVIIPLSQTYTQWLIQFGNATGPDLD